MADDSDQNQDDGRGHERPEREEEAPANNVGLIPLGNQGTLADPALTDPSMDGAQPGAPPSYPDSLLGNPHLSGRGNSPVREAIVQRWQQTYGNRATQRMLQRFKEGTGPSESDDLAERIQSKSGSGTGLEPGVRVQLERTVGADMSNVQVHTDSEAHRLAQSVDAVAFTTGSDIFFREGAYNPGSADGMKLLAHEATHTVQQSQGPVSGTPTAGGVSISDPPDSYEQEASRVAESVAAAPPQSPQAAAPASSNAVQAQRTHAHREDEEQESPLPMQTYRPSQPAVQREAAPGDERDEEQQLIPESNEPLQRVAASSASPIPVQRDGDAGAGKSQGTATTTIEPTESDTYDIEADSLEDAYELIKKRDEAGETTWNPVYDYKQEDGKVTEVTVTVKIKVTMPNWPGASKLNKEAKAEWDRFYKALQTHEDGHVKIAQEKFKDLADKMIGKSEATAKAEFAKAKKAAKEASDKYDKDTNHGKTQGTIINLDAGKPKASSSSAGSESTESALAGDTSPAEAEREEGTAEPVSVQAMRIGQVAPGGLAVQRSPTLPRVQRVPTSQGGVAVQRRGGHGRSAATVRFAPVVNTTYEVSGTTLAEASESIEARDEAGETTWEPHYTATYDDNGHVRSVTVTVTLTVLMPRWPGRAHLNRAARAEWDRFVGALRAHENGHVTRAREHFREAANRLIGKTAEEAEQEWQTILQEVQDNSDEYDADTDHGRNAGTVLDEDAGSPSGSASSSGAATSSGAPSH